MTTLKGHDLPTLQRLLGEEPPPLEAAGLQPTADQIELYAYHLPNATLSNLMVCAGQLPNTRLSKLMIYVETGLNFMSAETCRQQSVSILIVP